MVQKHDELRLLIQDVNEEITDLAEGHLVAAVREGKEWAVKLWLQERGQERGYGQRRLAFKDQEGQMVVPATLVAQPRMSIEAWEAKYGSAGASVQ